MKLNFKVILVGGVVYYAAQWIISMVTGPLIHDGILEAVYRTVPEF